MKILLTGGTGYIGSHTAVALNLAGHELVLLDNFCNSKVSVLERLQSILGHALTFIQADVRDTVRLTSVMKSHGIEAVVHFAGLKAVGESMVKPLSYFSNNVQGMVSVLEAMQANQIKNLVFSSSATVYGDPQYLPIDEMHPTSTTNPYGRTKLHIEEMLYDVTASDPVWKVACLRYFNPVGAHESALIGEDPNGVPNNLMPYLAQVAAGLRPALQVFGNDFDTPDGTGVRDYIHVMDVAQGHLAAILNLQNQDGWQAYNLGTGQGISVLDMVHAFEQATGQNVKYKIVERRPGDVASSFANVKKANLELSWWSQRNLHQMCSDAWAWQQQSMA